jgi:hypothetical protein
MIRNLLCRALPVAAALVFGATMFSASPVQAQYGRQYYTTWSYYPTYGYYYTNYRYQTYVDAPSYDYHYCVYYPSQRYVYYYNPVRRVYWGRYDLEKQGYSMLEEKDRKAELKDIPESAFPAPGKMPNIPEAKDAVAMSKPPEVPSANAPTGKAPDNAPK